MNRKKRQRTTKRSNWLEKIFQPVVGGLLAISILPPAQAADHTNLEEGLPTQVVDAYATAYLNREIQGLFRYEHTDDNKDRFVLAPRLEYGFARNWQLEVEAPFLLGDADRTGSGNVRLGALYNFNIETLTMPAFAVSARVDIPSGKNSNGADTTLKFIASKMLVRGDWWNVLHFNIGWNHNSGRLDDERENYYQAVLGYSFRTGTDTIMIVDLVRREERKKHEESNLVELGLRRQITPLMVLTGGLGAGFGDESPDVQATAGFQYSF
jgi:hypothetical protein